MHALAGPLHRLAAVLANERERWILWLPVLVGIGIGVYFALPAEPPGWVPAALAAAAAGGGGLAIALAGERRALVQPLVVAMCAFVVGFVVSQTKAAWLATPTLQERLGPVTVGGRVDRAEAFPDGVRLTLDHLSIGELAAGEVPERVRIRLRGKQPQIRPGDRVQVRAMLMPPPAPSVPGGFDFQRQAYFEGLGGVGYSVGTAEVLAPADAAGDGLGLWFAKLRHLVGERVRAHVPGATGAVTVALFTGETRAIPEPVMVAIRDSGLAHLLSISGLHIGLVAAIVLIGVRSALALLPWLALRVPIKKWAAVVSVLAAGAYTLLAAAPVPSQRSFLMVAVVLLAILVDRQGLSIRLVAFAALVILLTQPEAMLGPSFQMSFAAVTALIVLYEHLRDRRRPEERPAWPRRALLYLGGVVLSTLVAGTATAPFAAYHFNRFQVYGVAANMLAIPLTGFWIMPLAVLSSLLMPFGLEGLALAPMAWGVGAVIAIAGEVASWPGAVVLLPPMPPWGLAAIALGGLWLCLWRTGWRWLGLLGIAAGLAGMLAARVPDLLVDGGARLLAVRTADGGLLFSSKSAGRSVREAWLRRAGRDSIAGVWPASGTSPLAPLRCDSLGCIYSTAGRTLAVARRGEALIEDCRLADVVVSLVPVRGACPSAATLIDRFDLWREGSHALWIDADAVRIESVAARRGERPWVIERRARVQPASPAQASTADDADDADEDESPRPDARSR